MPFVSDIAGPQRPLQTGPDRLPGSLRRTSSIDTHPSGSPTDPSQSDVDLRGRDVLTLPSGGVEVLDRIALHAHLSQRVIGDIEADGVVPDELGLLVGQRVGPGFRSTLGKVLAREVQRASLLHLLLDDWAGASLVSGYATQHAAITHGVENPLPLGVADSMSGICAGFAADASLIDYARQHGTIPSVHGPIAPRIDRDDPDGMHPVEPLRAHGMRRRRRLDLAPTDAGQATFDAHFRDSHVDADGAETIVHEYAVEGGVDLATLTITAISATVRVLPWQECPGAIDSASRVIGMRCPELRQRIRGEFVGTSTCTHLNDTLRALGDVAALAELVGVR